MFELENVIFITNNDLVYNKYKKDSRCIYMENYYDVLIKTRDMIYDKYELLTHPQASSLKPNQTPYRSIMLYKQDKNRDNTNDIMLVEKCIQVYNEWQDIAKTPTDYDLKVAIDFKTIDLSVIDNIVDRL